jgi:hypothetical protein
VVDKVVTRVIGRRSQVTTGINKLGDEVNKPDDEVRQVRDALDEDAIDGRANIQNSSVKELTK